MFYIELDSGCIASRAPYVFNFDHLCPLIKIFFEEGMQTLELGPLLSRGFLPDGSPDMYTADFKCAIAPEVSVDSFEGYALMTGFIRALADFLRENGWAERVVFHIHDEPDIHYKDDEALQARRRQYFFTADILRRHLPGVRVIEAVESTAFRGGVDIWVPVTASYENTGKSSRGWHRWEKRCGRMFAAPAGPLAQPLFGYPSAARAAVILGLRVKQDERLFALGLQSVPAGDGPLCRNKLPQPTRVSGQISPVGTVSSFTRARMGRGSA